MGTRSNYRFISNATSSRHQLVEERCCTVKKQRTGTEEEVSVVCNRLVVSRLAILFFGWWSAEARIPVLWERTFDKASKLQLPWQYSSIWVKSWQKSSAFKVATIRQIYGAYCSIPSIVVSVCKKVIVAGKRSVSLEMVVAIETKLVGEEVPSRSSARGCITSDGKLACSHKIAILN